MCTRVTASVDYHLASSQTKFALLVRQSIQLIIMKQYLRVLYEIEARSFHGLVVMKCPHTIFH